MKKEYKKKVIIFLDILGIKNFTESAEDEDLFEVYSRLENIREFCLKKENLEKFLEFEGKEFYSLADVDSLDINVSVLSDSLVISFSKKHLIVLSYILRMVRIFQIYLLSKGLLMKGIVIYDQIYQSNMNNMIFGKGLVNAYTQEQKIVDPVVEIDESLWDIYQKEINNNTKIKSYLTKFKYSGDIDSLVRLISFDSRIMFQKPQNRSKFSYNYANRIEATLKELFQMNVIKRKNKHRGNLEQINEIVDDNIGVFSNELEVEKRSKILDKGKCDELSKRLGRWVFTENLISSGMPKEYPVK